MTIYIVDDHNLFREGLSFLLSEDKDITNIYEAKNGKELLNEVCDKKPDVVLMDIDMPVMNGIEATRKTLNIYPDTKIIALSMYSNENFYREMIDAGAKGFLLKNSDFEDVKKAITDVMSGKSFFSTEILTAIIKNLNNKKSKSNNDILTEREVEILYNICKGYSNHEIGDILNISKRTVDKHRENLLLKTESRNTAGLVIYAIKNGVFEV